MTMLFRRSSSRAAVGLFTAAILALVTLGGVTNVVVLDAQQRQPASDRITTEPATTAVADPGWPRAYTTPSGSRVQIHQPQIASWEGQKHLVAYVAVVHQAKGADKPTVGTAKIEADTMVALEERLVRFAALKITETNFGSIGRERTRAIVSEIEGALPDFERVIALDRVLAGLDRSRILPKNVAGVKADPPAIFFSTTPAVLVSFDGDPIWSPIKDNDLKFAINTNWDVFEHSPTKTLFLRDEHVWLKASAITGPWTPAGTLPASFNRLPSDENWKDVKASLPGRRIAASDVPAVFVSTAQAELILLRGSPSYVLVSDDSRLLWINNTDSDVFRLGRTGPVYYLVAGRWFTAPDFGGPWTFATPSLPPEFQRISVEHPRSRVLASVPGTPQAAEAVVLAQIPHSARVNKKNLKAPEVIYQGEPQFQPIERTSLQRAVNTDLDIIKVGDIYYMCVQGVWFMSTSPRGPWEVASAVPTQIYSIPVSSPVYHVTYVTVVDHDPDWVVFATGAGYSGVTIAWGCVVWGTGWYYPPYVWYAGAYPVYYPFYPTYGYSAWYNPWTAAFERGAVAYGPYGGVGAAARYNPYTGTYARGAMAWGPYGANGVAQAYNPRTGAYAQTRQGAGVYGSWGSAYVQRGDDWAHTARATNRITGNTARVTRTDEGAMVSRTGPAGRGFVAAGEEGIYAGQDGNVYRRAEDGGWQKYENGNWGTTQRPRESAIANGRERAASAGASPDGSTISQLERDRAARAEGTQRTREHGSLRAGDRGNAGTYRPSGARRGGGGRRR
jgi:hypothetical protein